MICHTSLPYSNLPRHTPTPLKGVVVRQWHAAPATPCHTCGEASGAKLAHGGTWWIGSNGWHCPLWRSGIAFELRDEVDIDLLATRCHDGGQAGTQSLVPSEYQ